MNNLKSRLYKRKSQVSNQISISRKLIEYNNYLDISKSVKNIIILSINNLRNEKKLNVILTAIAHHLILDLYKLAKVAFELDLIKKKKITDDILPFSEIVSYLITKTKKTNLNIFGNNAIYSNRRNILFNIKNSIRFYQARFNLKFSKNNLFLHNQSYLLNSLIAGKESPVLLRPEQWPKTVINNSELDMIISIIRDEFKNLLLDLCINKKILENTLNTLEILIKPKIIYSLSFYSVCDSVDFNNVKNKFIIGGAPQILGKILNYFFINNGGKVRRFAHGGDRVFFSDFFWGISELPYCNEYYVHSKAEKIFLKQKLKEKKIYDINNSNLLIKTLGSPKHQKILNSEKPQKGNKKVMFVPGSLLGEDHQALPEFKIPDYLIIDYQIWLLKVFKLFKFDLSVKVHPFGIKQSTFINNFCEKIITSRFDISRNTSSVLIFDFAGSAFFDSLASNKGIILLDTGIRPFFSEAFMDLKKRCNIVKSFFDKKNRIRFDADELKNAINKALEFREVSVNFSKKYFFK